MKEWYAVFRMTMLTIGMIAIDAAVLRLRSNCAHKPSAKHARYQLLKGVELGDLIESSPEEVM